MFQQTHFSFFSSFTIFYKFPPYSLGINMQHICKRTRFRFFFDILKFFHILSFYYVEEVKKYRTRKRIISKRGLYSWIMNTPGVSRARCNKNNILRPMDSIVKALNWNEEKKCENDIENNRFFYFIIFLFPHSSSLPVSQLTRLFGVIMMNILIRFIFLWITETKGYV